MRAILALSFCCLFLVAAVCTEQEAQDYLSQGTDYIFEERLSADIAIVLDRSGSMRGGKLAQAKVAASSLVQQLSGGDRAAIIGFDDSPRLYSALTNESTELLSAIERMQSGDFTQYRPALELAYEQFNGNRRYIVLLSDGRPDDEHDAMLSTVDTIVSDEVCIFTIAYADSADEQAQQLLQEISQESQKYTGCGQYFRAGEGTSELQTVFDDIYQTVATDALLDVEATVSTGDPVLFEVSATSTLNQRPIIGQACFGPQFQYQVLRNRVIVHDETTSERSHIIALSPGNYEYRITLEETCGGACRFTGRTEGTFSVEAGSTVCRTPWEELSVMLTSNEYVEVQISSEGFSPQTVGTQGMVVWRNTDSVARRVRAPDGSWISPYIQPGETWTRLFPAGVYAYVDATTGYSGVVQNENAEDHEATDLILVLDKSGSMAGASLSAAKAAASNLLGILTPADRAALIVFSDRARVVQSLTTSSELLSQGVQSVLSEGSTFYLEAIRLVGDQLERSSSSREQVVIFLSDGGPYDDGGKKAIISALDEELGSACLYTIGYGEQSVNAIDLLSSMADHIQNKNGCGEFYFSTADKTELSAVFGEIYALTQQPGLEIFNVSVPSDPGTTFEMRLRVRSRLNGLAVPSVSEFGCIPEASVSVDFGTQRFPLTYHQGLYKGNVSLSPGDYTGVITARVGAPDEPARVVVGTVPVTVRVRGIDWIFWSLVGFGAILIGYIFIRRRATLSYDL